MTLATDPRPHTEALHNLAAEQALLGCVLYDNSALAAIGGLLTGADFAEPMHGWCFDAMAADIAAGRLVEPVMLHERAQVHPAYAALGGLRYLADLVDRAPSPSSAPDYAAIIFDLARRRSLVAACQRIAAETAADRETPVFGHLSAARAAVEDLERGAAPADADVITAPKAARAAVDGMIDRARHGRALGRLTGLRCVDWRLGGLKPGALVVIGGRPGMGKTALARAIAHGAARRNPDCRFMFLGLEMGPEEMMQRELSALTHEEGDGVEYRGMSSGRLTPDEIARTEHALARVPANLDLADCSALSVDDVRRRVWSAQRAGPVGAVIIDYLQLMRRPDARGRNEASVIGEMTAALKQIARQARVCVVLLSQLNRSVESRDDKRPQMSDLRESGSIEQDADVVLFPFREYYYLARAEPPPDMPGQTKHLQWEQTLESVRRRLDVICVKQRQGPEGMDRQRYWAEFDHIEDEGQP